MYTMTSNPTLIQAIQNACAPPQSCRMPSVLRKTNPRNSQMMLLELVGFRPHKISRLDAVMGPAPSKGS
jgi:hypothetical protein